MTNTTTATPTTPSGRLPALLAAHFPALRPEALTRARVGGAFSAIDTGPIGLQAEAGMVIRIRAGALWVPQPELCCSTCFGAGEQVRVREAGPMQLQAERGTELELVWPQPLH